MPRSRDQVVVLARQVLEPSRSEAGKGKEERGKGGGNGQGKMAYFGQAPLAAEEKNQLLYFQENSQWGCSTSGRWRLMATQAEDTSDTTWFTAHKSWWHP